MSGSMQFWPNPLCLSANIPMDRSRGHWVAYAKPLLRKYHNSDIHFFYEVLIVAIRRFAHDQLDPIFNFYSFKVTEWPCWFQEPRKYLRLNSFYPRLREAFSSGFEGAQIIYSWEQNGYVQLWVHTPGLSPPDTYAIYETEHGPNNDLFGLEGRVKYVYHRSWNGDPLVTMDLLSLRWYVHHELFHDVWVYSV